MDLLFYNTIDSTNLEARRLLAARTVRDGCLIMSEQQAGGRGQHGRYWHTTPGKQLAMSLILLPTHMPATGLPQANMKVSLAIVRVLHKAAPSVSPKIKWPNDILVDGHKLAGILIENAISGMNVQSLIIGIGMNVNESAFPPELPNAVSLHMLTSNTFDRNAIAIDLRKEIMNLMPQPYEIWKEEYNEVLFGLHERFVFNMDGRLIPSEVMGVDDHGRILLNADGRTTPYYTHETKWIH